MDKSLQRQDHQFADPAAQVRFLSDIKGYEFPSFTGQLREHGLSQVSLKPMEVEILQINLGKMCNQVCKHCHVDAGPDRKEIMTRETMKWCLKAMETPEITTVDLTGGAPEMNPDFRWFVEEIHARKKHILVRSNLTILVSNPRYHDMPAFYKENGVEVVSSLPYFTARRTDAQRGEGVFERSVRALKMLNEVGYGKENSGLVLNLVYNPAGAYLPASQCTLEAEYRERLKNNYDIIFNNLFTITNLPVSRFLKYLISSGNYEGYMEKLANAFNPTAAEGVMCRTLLSVGWDGFLYDCDFNQMLELKLSGNAPKHIRDFDVRRIKERDIIFKQHCFGCTAGAGSSCGGETA